MRGERYTVALLSPLDGSVIRKWEHVRNVTSLDDAARIVMTVDCDVPDGPTVEQTIVVIPGQNPLVVTEEVA